MNLEKGEHSIHLVDTTVWIDFFNGSHAVHVEYLEKLLKERETIATCGVITTEILQGIASSKELKMLEEYLRPLVFLNTTRSTYIKAANIHRKMRQNGITIRKTIDCIIAAIALEHKCVLLHNDKDFDRIKSLHQLQTIEFSVCH